MAETGIEPHKITRFVQLPAVWLGALVLLVGAFLGAGLMATELWVRLTFVIAAVALIPLFVGVVFLLQTRYRPELLEDPHYVNYRRRQEVDFKDFRPENLQSRDLQSAAVGEEDETWEELERKRIEIYEKSEGLFLVHTWRPSQEPGQIADIAIRLHQHGDGPLSQGQVKSVEYHLGPKFFEYPVIQTDPRDQFRLDVSAYGPMLCLARVHFHDDGSPLLLTRYVDFDTSLPPQQQ